MHLHITYIITLSDKTACGIDEHAATVFHTVMIIKGMISWGIKI